MKIPVGNDRQPKRAILLPSADGMGAARWLRIGKRWLTLPAWPWEATMLTAANCYVLWSFFRFNGGLVGQNVLAGSS
ncbi:MAG: hypothetical protein MUF04_00700 [Akkermansiaceae bacterium]|nr:hypothetical protein [Akkermansiaceae bacterium]